MHTNNTCTKECIREESFIFAEVAAVELEVEGDQPSLVGDLQEGEVAFPLEEEEFQGEEPCVEVDGVASFQGVSYL